jgi:predicted Co/Zn/Cd cation transporter (cation efflux family)
MKILALLFEIVRTVVCLLEAEGRMLKRAVMRVGWALAFVGIAASLLLGSLALLLAGIYQYLVAQMSSAAATLVVSLLAFVLALVFAGIARWRAS